MDELRVEVRPGRPDAEDEASLLQATLDSTYDGILVVDLDGRIVRWNQRLVSMWRIPEGVVASRDIGRAFEYFTNQVADPTSFVNGVNVLIADPERTHFDVIELKDGRVFERHSLPCRHDGKVVVRVVSYRDVTERENAIRELRRREEQLAEQQKLAQIGSWELNIRTGEAEWSDELYRIFGYSPDDFSPSVVRFLDRVHPEDRGWVEEALASTSPSQPLGCTYRILQRDGTSRVVHTYGHVVEEDELSFVLRGFSQDITEKEELEHQVHQSQKMSAVGRLAGGVAHDLNNLLTAVFGNSQILQEESLSEPARVAAAEIELAASSAAALMGQLLNLSRQQPSAMQIFDIDELLEPLRPLLRSLIPEDIVLEILPNSDGARVRMPAAQFEQILLNLVINSRDAIPQGAGKITITTSRVVVQGNETFAREMLPGSYVLVSVSDTGTGMDKETRDRAFEPFFTTKEGGDVQGMGLGLSTVYGIAKHLGGNVLIESEVGSGAVVRVYLPETTEKVRTEMQSTSVQHDLTGTETVLVVEDDRAVREVVRRGLETYGYRVFSASQPHEAIEISEARPAEIDLVISDVVMLDLSGPQTVDRVWVDQPQARVLFMSGYPQTLLDRAQFQTGDVAFIRKPIRLPALAAKVREVLDSR